MGFVYRFFSSVSTSFEWLKAKIGTVLLVVFSFGLLAGRFFALNGFSVWVFVAFFLAIPIMWKDLDEGFLALIVFLIIAANTV